MAWMVVGVYLILFLLSGLFLTPLAFSLVAEKTMVKSEADLSVGFLGAGMMATSIMDGLIAKKVVTGPEAISCSDCSDAPLKNATSKGIFATKSNEEVCQRSKDAVVIAVKPNFVLDVCKDIMKVKNNAVII